MRIGLIDVDGHNFPNLAIMKLSAFHKKKGDSVDWASPIAGPYDTVYQSKVFTFTPDYEYFFNADQVIRGGTGYDLENKLLSEVENTYPDYSLYGIKNTAYGFLTRGCPRNCGFCIVSRKEGCRSVKVADLKQFWNGQREIKLLDPNLLASPDRLELLQQLADSKAWVDFTQGLDIRCTDDSVIDLIRKIKVKTIHFAWDSTKHSPKMIEHFGYFREKSGIDDYRKLKVYVLTNFDTTFEEDIYRINVLRELGYDPYVMIYEKQKAPRNVRLLQRWVNNKIIFRSCERFEDYNSKIG